MYEALFLLSLGFVVGLSGAIIPGPLLAFTVFDTSKKQKMTGHTIILGHAIWELLIILIIVLGFGEIITHNESIFYLIGGLTLFLMGINMIFGKSKEIKLQNSRVNSSLLGGIFYTAFNPTQPPWWATAGLALLLTGVDMMGLLGLVLVTAGHWLSDLAYYTSISYMVQKQGKYINPHLKEITILLGVFMDLLGIYFIVQGL